MKTRTYIIAANSNRYESIVEQLNEVCNYSKFIFINNNEQLNFPYIESINPKYIFFPHWSYKIPKEIYEKFECIIFHMTDLPFGRGGSPLQNLISRGIYETKMSALRCVEDFDAGPIYLKRPFSLYGNAEEIYLRASKIIVEMIKIIIENELMPIKQVGEATVFNRRKPDESNISHLQSLQEVFDYIRMLDAEGYPTAFLETEILKLEFSRAALKKDHIIADVKIMLKKDGT
ncbi:methionyl-tRNA formyltransferase [Lysinibacillus fusiformis]|uniref:Methionyl-tRNA formyltransferase n=1 Tax=Lysinibacillus fusiformis TaxID=28031 RepID=A0A1H9M0V6_9BACI|nr:methionyl-tRNA formyltransferase [Lysinibacillus fusiformis]SCY58407.1 methionyl-tRNA formyltransferase [Lysinibacillus fusiformis]SEO15862.1 methionyl-tRNA formyltransferase [Lysinibacillus fusiformis]SER17314.1 methionyl-tRNA formyltransferase [Lysinibacillus fusiformis]